MLNSQGHFRVTRDHFQVTKYILHYCALKPSQIFFSSFMHSVAYKE